MVLDMMLAEVFCFSLSDGSDFGQKVIIFGVDMSSSGHVDDRKGDILILGKGPMEGLDNTTVTKEKEYAIHFSEQQKKFCLSLHDKGGNSYLLMVLKCKTSKQKILK